MLDQGYWSDTLMTAPTDEDLVHDIQLGQRVAVKRLDINNACCDKQDPGSSWLT